MKTLAGDRGIEWTWAMDHLPVGKGWVLDLGPMDFNLSLHATLKGYEVIAVGLEPLEVVPNVRYVRQDVLSLDEGWRFDYILNTSTVEHIGLGRYGDPLGENNDLLTMARLRGWMKADGKHILTVPVGRDGTIGEWHRVYGWKRLPKLLAGYEVLEEAYWVKAEDDSAWVSCAKGRALNEVPTRPPVKNIVQLSYAIGCFVLGL